MQIKSRNVLNLFPMMNLVLILFVLVWCIPGFSTFYEIASSTLVSNEEGLRLMINQNQMTISRGPSTGVIKKISRDLNELHKALSEIKNENANIKTITLIPSDELTYEELVKIMNVAKDVSTYEIHFGNLGE